MYPKAPILDKDEIIQDIDKAFELYDKITWFQFVGGELFLHPDLAEIVERTMEHRNQFERLIFMTNATVLPNAATLDVFQKNRDCIEIQISDYGKLSRKLDEMVKLFEENGICYVIKSFHGDMQHYGGWVDPGDFTKRQETVQETFEKYHSCWQIELENLHMYKGKIHNCPRSIFVQDLHKAEIPDKEYIDLRSDKYSLEEKRDIARSFNRNVLTACRYCNGFCTKNSKRYPAAEQILGSR
jgi:hypothetical protein